MALPKIVTEAEWQAERDRLLATEKAATHALDALAAQRRRLPMVRFRSDYAFEGPDGTVTLLDAFEGRRQLVVYHFMDTGPDSFCPGCTSYVDNTDAPKGREALHGRDTSYVVISAMPLDQIESYKRSRGWTVPFLSCHGTTFHDDCVHSPYFGLSAFLRDGDDVYRTYFTNGRGVDRLRLEANILDLTPLGRQEDWEEAPDASPRTEGRFEVIAHDGSDT